MGECAAAGRRLGKGPRGGCNITVGPAGQRDARPFDAERPGIGGAVGRIMEHRENMVEQIFRTYAESFNVTLRRP